MSGPEDKSAITRQQTPTLIVEAPITIIESLIPKKVVANKVESSRSESITQTD